MFSVKTRWFTDPVSKIIDYLNTIWDTGICRAVHKHDELIYKFLCPHTD